MENRYLNLEKSGQILLINSSRDVISEIYDILREKGYTLSILSKEDEILPFIQKKHPDLIVVDNIYSNSYNLIPAIQKIPNHYIPILNLLDSRAPKNERLQEGITDFITYPFEKNIFIQRVKNMILLKKLYENLDSSRQTISTLEYQLAQEKQLISLLSITDNLTGCYNRKHIFNRLNEEIERSIRYKTIFSIFIIDIDNFTKINQTYGFEKGDSILKKISKTIKNEIREIDLVGRDYGEQFIVIFPQTPLKKGVQVAKRIKESIERLEWDNNLIKITLSGSVVEYQDGENDYDIIKRGKSIVTTIKERGGNTIIGFNE